MKHSNSESKRKQPQLDTNANIESKTSKCSVFLRKTYHMVDESDSNILGWSEDGKYIIIKQPDVFASTIIPQYFKHNNVQSFIRQLNLYGFQKIKNETIVDAGCSAMKNNCRYLCFCHDQFIRGRPELLYNISKPTQKPVSNDKKEVNVLRSEVEGLRKVITRLTNEVSTLTSITKGLIFQFDKTFTQQNTENICVGSVKKRKITTKDMNVNEAAPTGESFYNEFSSQGLSKRNNVSSSTLPMDLSVTYNTFVQRQPNDNNVNAIISPDDDTISLSSFDFGEEDLCEIDEVWPEASSCFDEISHDHGKDNDVMNNMFVGVMKESEQNTHVKSVSSTASLKLGSSICPLTKKLNSIGSEYINKLNTAINMLPNEMRPLYTVEKLLLNITDHECLKKQIDDIFQLAIDIHMKKDSTSTKQMKERLFRLSMST